MSRSPAPQALHLQRLAKGQPNSWLALPHSNASILWLTQRRSLAWHQGSLLCLSGAVIIDLPDLQFVALEVGQSYICRSIAQTDSHTPDCQIPQILPSQGAALLLWLPYC